MSKGLFKSTGVVSSMTFLSRITGFIRDMIAAHLFGATGAVDAFLVAFKPIPICNFVSLTSLAFVQVLIQAALASYNWHEPLYHPHRR